MRFDRHLMLVAATTLLGGGCVVFDESLYKNLDPKNADPDSSMDEDGNNDGDGDTDGDPNGGDDAGLMDGGGDGSGDGDAEDAGGNEPEDAGPPRLVDQCDPDEAFLLRGDLVQFTTSTAGFNDDVTESACFPDYDLPGPEGWIGVRMEAGDKFHFHIDPLNEVGQGQQPQNPVVYMRSDCSDDRGCNPGTYLDLCGDQGDEHFTFEATSASTWYLAVDDKNGAAGSYRITAYRPKDVCGNGKKDHNETCDDGNKMSGDECSSDCRQEILAQDETGFEVNDDWTTANILSLITSETGGTQAVKGSVGGACDVDMYAFQVQANGKVSVKVNKQNKTPCIDVPDTASSVKLELLKGDGRTLLGQGTLRPELVPPNSCPTIEFTDAFAHGLEEGLYYLRVSGEDTKDVFGYELVVTSSKD